MSKITINVNATRSPPPKTNSNGNWIWIVAIAIAAYYYYPQISSTPTTQTPQPAENIAQTPTSPQQPTSQNYILPVKGRISSGFGMRAHPILKHKSGPKKGQPITRLHGGIDISAPTGTPIKAAASGTVIFAGWNGGYGNCIKIKHPNGYTTLYAHNSKNLVKKNQKVKQGETIAKVGSTGLSTGPHLHWEVRKPNGTKIDPENKL